MSSSITKQQIWLLDDGRLGHLRQSQAMVSAICAHTETFKAANVKQHSFEIPAIHRLLAPRILPGADAYLNQWLPDSLPAMIVGAGRRCAWMSRLLRRRFPEVFTVQILNPGCHHKQFSLLIVPEHDDCDAGNVLRMRGSLTDLSNPLDKDDEKLWPDGQHIRLAALLAGKDQQNRMLLKQIEQRKLQIGHVVLSKGPRTASRTLQEFATGGLAADVTIIKPDKGGKTYRSMLRQANQFWVAADSINQLSEVLSARQGQSIWVAGSARSKRKRKWLKGLLERQEIRLLRDYPTASSAHSIQQSQSFWQNQTSQIAREVLSRYLQHHDLNIDG